jgi:hypothetical protein
MLLIGLESSHSPHQCSFRPLLPMLLRTNVLLPREPAECEFLLKSSRALPRGVLLTPDSFPLPTRLWEWSSPKREYTEPSLFRFEITKIVRYSVVTSCIIRTILGSECACPYSVSYERGQNRFFDASCLYGSLHPGRSEDLGRCLSTARAVDG